MSDPALIDNLKGLEDDGVTCQWENNEMKSYLYRWIWSEDCMEQRLKEIVVVE